MIIYADMQIYGDDRYPHNNCIADRYVMKFFVGDDTVGYYIIDLELVMKKNLHKFQHDLTGMMEKKGPRVSAQMDHNTLYMK